MENQQALFKGELMEELIRGYFLNMGYFVVRGIKYRFQSNDLTDVDTFLYGRSSTLTRERINVDIKNKKSPQALERILWANGLMKLLRFDKCIVATSDSRSMIHSFGQLHETTILDGNFLSRLKEDGIHNRLTEEDLLAKFALHKGYKEFLNKDWKFIYESIKSKLLTEMDYSGFNSLLNSLQYFVEKTITDNRKRDDATRMTYIIISYLFLIMDYILKDIAFLEQSIKERKLHDGLMFGNLGKEGVDTIISVAVEISGNKSAQSIRKSLENNSIDILRDYFSKNENAKNIFGMAKSFESLCFRRDFKNPNLLDPTMRGAISVFLDYFKVDRKKYFNSFPEERQVEGSEKINN